jgi:hypothetical protein
VIAIAVIAGVVAGLNPPAPTGQGAVDLVYVVVAVAFVTWVAASAPWWLLTITAAVAIGIGAIWPLMLLGAVAFALAVWIGTQRSDLSPWRAVSAGLALNVMVRGQLDIFFGASALLAVAMAVAVLIGGGLRRRTRDRRIIVTATVWVVAVWLVASVVLLVLYVMDVMEAPEPFDSSFPRAEAFTGAIISAFRRVVYLLDYPIPVPT